MKRVIVAAVAAVPALLPALAAAQPAPARDLSQDVAWHNQQQAALAGKLVTDGWSWMEGGLLWRRAAGDGSGRHPTVDDSVTLHYEGTLTDGTVFDSSYRRGQPATFPLRGLIRAWQLAVPQMGVGDTIEIALPAELGYGLQGRGPIPGGATLLFKIELLGIPSQ